MPDTWQLNLHVSDLVKQKMRSLEEMIDRFYFDEGGLLRCMFHLDPERGEVRTFRPEDHAGQSLPKLPSDAATPDGYHYYENCGYSSGLLLASQCLRHQATGEEAALALAAKAFRSIDVIFRMTESEGHRGYLCKPYDRKVTHETSPDQYVNVARGLWAYRPLADPATRTRIDELLPAMADWWRERDYTLTYFGWEFRTLDYGSHRSIMPYMNHLAYLVTKDPKYLDETRRLLTLCGTWPTAIDEARQRMLDGGGTDWPEMAHGREYDSARLPYLMLDPGWRCATLSLPAIDHFMTAPDFPLSALLPSALGRFYRCANMGLRDDLLYLFWIQIDLERDAWHPVRAAPTAESLSKALYAFEAYYSEVCVGNGGGAAAILAVVAHQQARAFCPGALTLARELFRRLDTARLAWFIDPDGRQLLPELRYMRETIEDAPFNMLLAYWYARAHGIALE